jgi:solute carrier family 6 amino acid transporter-like protein 5/7/9/14
MICLTGVVCMYYNVIIAWTLYYLLYSFFPTIPWSTCDNDFNTDACYQRGQHLNVSSSYSDTVINITRKTTTEEFWEYVQYTANNKLNGTCYNTHIAKSEHFQNLIEKS